MRYGILSVDPGKTSGVCFMVWDKDSLEKPNILYTIESSQEDYATHVVGGLRDWRDYDEFIVSCERFIINAQTVRNSQAPYSLEQIGVLKHLCRENGFSPEKIAFQAPVDAKNMFPNKVLQKLELWHRGGDGHANDAIRHGLLALTRRGWIPREILS